MVAEQHAGMVVAPEPASVGEARRFVRAALDEWDVDAFEETATLLVSEVVTNLVLHARTSGELLVRLSAGRLRVELHDGSPLLPTAKRYGLEATTGRGVGLLEAMTSGWGAELTPSGKRVWFELDVGTVAAGAGERAAAAAFFDTVDLGALEAELGAADGAGRSDGHGRRGPSRGGHLGEPRGRLARAGR
jgi:anti-sigma regulatory factor (Ser/Thr protein kinase)